uniref:Uncharacterized protein n=1 Tax=Parascaris univalens TaxID=6257 RepID=A0A915BZ48_PARUN
MLGAQALRTKQKVEQKEKEKRQRERQKNLELQRERIQKVAREDAQALIEIANEQKKHPAQQTRHHSLHPVSAMNSHMPSMSGRVKHNSSDMLQLPERSPSTDLGKASDEGSSGSRFMKWLGLSQGRRESKKPRRMSTFS